MDQAGEPGRTLIDAAILAYLRRLVKWAAFVVWGGNSDVGRLVTAYSTTHPFRLSEMSLMNLNWRDLPAAYIPLKSLFGLFTEAQEPVSPSALVLTFAKTQLWRHGTMPLKLVLCNPKLTYCIDNSDQFVARRIVRLAGISSGRTSIQGQFRMRAFTEAHFSRWARSRAS